jgi:hypothetical protein
VSLRRLQDEAYPANWKTRTDCLDIQDFINGFGADHNATGDKTTIS